MSVTLAGFACAAPTSGPTATAGSASGNLDTSANYNYKVTYVTGFGETTGSSAGAVTTTSTGSVNLTSIPLSPNGNVTQRKIYRTVGGGASYLLLATIDDNTTTTYADTAADADLGAAMPTINTAHSLNYIEGNFKMVKPTMHSVETGITAGVGGSSSAAYQLSAEYSWVSTVASTNDSVKLPALSTAYIGLKVEVKNLHANTMRVYPFDGQTINGGSADAPVTVATTVSSQFVATSATNFQQI